MSKRAKEKEIQEAEEILAYVESDVSEMHWHHQRAEKFRQAGELFKSARVEERAKQMQWEFDIFSFTLKPKESIKRGKRGIVFAPMLVLSDGRAFPDFSKYQANKEALAYFEKRALGTKNPFHRSRYADFIWEARRKHNFAKMAIEAYFKSIPIYLKNDWQSEMVDTIQRATEIVLTKGITSPKEKKNAAGKILGLMDELSTKDDFRYCLDLSRSLLFYKGILSKRQLKHALSILRTGAQAYKKQKESFLYRNFIEALEEMYKLLKDEQGKRNCRLQIAKSWEEQAEYNLRRKDKSYFLAANFFERAIREYQKLGEKEKVTEIKIKMRKAYEKAEKEEFKPISAEVKMPMEIIDGEINRLASLPIEKAIRIIVFEDSFIPSVKRAREEEKKRGFSFSRFVPVTVVSAGKGVKHFRDTKQIEQFRVDQSLLIGINISAFVLERVIGRLRKEGKLTATSLMEYLMKWELMPPESLPLVKEAIERYFVDDYASSIYILATQIEHILRYMFYRAGSDTTVVTEEGTKEATLGSFLNREAVKGVLGEDIHRYLCLALAAPQGLNLRNKVAHGLLSANECTNRNAIILLHLLLILTRFRIQERP